MICCEIPGANQKRLREILDELSAAAVNRPELVAGCLIEEARKDPEKIFEIIGLMENSGLEQVDDLRRSVLSSLEKKYIGASVWAVKAVESGWKISSSGEILGMDFEAGTPSAGKLGISAYSVNLLLDDDSNIRDIVKFAHIQLTDEWDLEIARMLGKAAGRAAVSDEIPYFPVHVYRQYLQKMEELLNSGATDRANR